MLHKKPLFTPPYMLLGLLFGGVILGVKLGVWAIGSIFQFFSSGFSSGRLKR